MKKILAFLVLAVGFVLGENAMAEGLNEAQKAIAESAIYTARGDQKGLKPALERALNAGVKLEELKEILVQSYAYCGFPRSLNALGTLMNWRTSMEFDFSMSITTEQGLSCVYIMPRASYFP